MSRPKQIRMLEDCIEFISIHDQVTQLEAFDKLLHWSAYHLGISDVVIKVKIDSYNYLKENLDLKILSNVEWDWFGELYCNIFNRCNCFSDKRSLKKVTERCITSLETKYNINNAPLVIFDQSVGTGRLLMTINNGMRDKVIFRGIEKELMSYRICLINMKMYKIPGYVLHTSNNNIDCSPDSINWDYSNMWTPVKDDGLKEVINKKIKQYL